MIEIFKTFKPQNPIIKKYVDYYYLDIKQNNVINEFQCFPHFKNTISLYTSHTQLTSKEIAFNKTAKPFQIFTPIQEKILNVKQLGKVYRIVIVFHPLGIHQFYRNVDFTNFVTNFEFFTQNELQKIFSTQKTATITYWIDQFLEDRFVKFDKPMIEKSIQYIFNHFEEFSVTEIAKEIGTSRQHLNRVFKSNLGVSIKKFHGIVVFRHTVNKKLFENSNQSFTEIAHEFNFSDQSHLNKTYKSLTKCSPKSFFSKGILLGKEDTFWHLKP